MEDEEGFAGDMWTAPADLSAEEPQYAWAQVYMPPPPHTHTHTQTDRHIRAHLHTCTHTSTHMHTCTNARAVHKI